MPSQGEFVMTVHLKPTTPVRDKMRSNAIELKLCTSMYIALAHYTRPANSFSLTTKSAATQRKQKTAICTRGQSVWYGDQDQSVKFDGH